MKRLLKICLDTSLLSFIPIVSWFLLGLILDSNLINVFTLTYPIQFVFYIFKSIFSTGANICQEKEKNKNAVMSGFVIGSIFAFLFFAILACNIDSYITFMNMDVTIYHNFATYSVLQVYIQLIFQFVLTKLYYEEKNDLANRYSILFNGINFFVLIACSLFFNNQVLIVTITLIAIGLFTCFITIKHMDRFHLHFNFLSFIKYDSVELVNNMFFFLIFLFGLSNAVVFGENYTLALTFVALITDCQWDTFDAIVVVAQIDISQGEFYMKEHLRNAYKLLQLLLLSTILMGAILIPFFRVELNLVIIYFMFELLNFTIYPIYRIKTCFLQLEYSSGKVTTNKVFANIMRMLCSFLATPFCTAIGQVLSSLSQFFILNQMFSQHFEFDETGLLISRTPNNEELGNLEYQVELETVYQNNRITKSA